MGSKLWIWTVALIVIIAGAYYLWTTRAPQTAPTNTNAPVAEANLGTYPYECDEHVAITMTPASDMSTITIAPAAGSAYPSATTTLMREASSSNNAYEGGGIAFSARGETITLGQGDSAINCSPVPDPNNAPFNFGD